MNLAVSADYSVGVAVPLCGQESSGLASLSRLKARCISAISYGSEVVSRTMSCYDGIDYGAKFINSVVLSLKIKYQAISTPVLDAMGDNISGVTGFTGAIVVFNRLNVFTSGEFRQKSIYKNIYNACLVIKGTADSLRWLASEGVIHLGKFAASIGGVRAISFVTMSGLKNLSNFSCIFGCLFDLVDARNQMAKAASQGKSLTRHWLTVAADVGKIGCCALSNYYFTPIFAGMALCTSVVQLWKTAYDKAAEI